MRLGIYIHIPFCISKCAYCDFLSFAGRDCDEYVAALCAELEGAAGEYRDYTVETVYFGGGTPTLLPASLLNKILQTVKNNYAVDAAAEITAEANPETAGLEKLSALREGGFNRLSIGVQAWQDRLLERLGRAHTADTAEQSFFNARKAGFANIGADLMFALPGQTLSDWEQSLRKTVALAPEHVSCYGLILEEGSRLAKDKGFVPADDETDRAMYYMAKDVLRGAGYKHYEISNFAIPGMESSHNSIYWTGGDYVGFGLGSHSFIGGVRFQNTSDFDAYTAGSGRKTVIETLGEKDRYAEFMILGLRLLDGVSSDLFSRRFGVYVEQIYGAELLESEAEGLLCRNGDRIFLTDKGLDLSNRVFVKFL